MTSFTRGTLYGDAVFDLEEKLAVWESQEEDTETWELEQLRNVFLDEKMDGSAAPYSKWFALYIDVLIGIVSYDFNSSMKSSLNQIKMNADFCSHLEEIHKQYVHIGTVIQLENYASGRERQYLGEIETKDENQQLEYYQEAIDAYEQCSGWLDSAKRFEDLKYLVADGLFADAIDFMMNGEYIRAYFAFQQSGKYGKNTKQYMKQMVEKIGYKPKSETDVVTVPKKLTVTDKTPNAVEFSWSKVKRAAEYQVYCKPESASSWNLVAVTKELSAVISSLTPGTYYDYKVIAVAGMQEAGKSVTHQMKSDCGMAEGSILKFGQYEQDNNYNNGKEPIEWVILSIDWHAGTAMLYSKYLLDCQVYHQARVGTYWKNSYIREWLNNAFYNSAFTTEEKSAILQTKVSDSLDYVFLLNAEQITSGNLANGGIATYYARAKGTYVAYDTGTSSWWVRTDYAEGTNGAFVGAHGKIYNSHNNDLTMNDNGIRPVIVVSLDQFSASK